METQPTPEKPERLYFPSYLQVLRNSVGTEMFRNFYILSPEGQQVDALDDGSNSCAFYVSSVLTIFGKHSGLHGTVGSTIEDLHESGWRQLDDGEQQPGDVLVWEPTEMDGKFYRHMGFYIGNTTIGSNRAVSTSWTKKEVVEHDANFGGDRAIEEIFRYDHWD